MFKKGKAWKNVETVDLLPSTWIVHYLDEDIFLHINEQFPGHIYGDLDVRNKKGEIKVAMWEWVCLSTSSGCSVTMDD